MAKKKTDEAQLAAKWQAHYGVQLKRFSKPAIEKGRKTQGSPDFVIIDPDKPESEWKTIDFMYTLSASADPVGFLQQFNKSQRAWQRNTEKIIQHLEKADIIPLYLKHFDLKTRTKIFAFVLSLPKEKRDQIIFVWD